MNTVQGSAVAVGSNEVEGEQGDRDSLDMDLHTIFMGDKLMVTWDRPTRNMFYVIDLKVFYYTSKFGKIEAQSLLTKQTFT